MLKAKSTALAAVVSVGTGGMGMSEFVRAQEASNNHGFTLDKVTVAATLTQEKLKDIASSVSVIDVEQIENNIATDIRELIRYEPGVEVSRNARFGLAGFNVRGFGGNRVKIAVDGVEQSRALNSGGPFLRGSRNFVDIDALKRVDILKGPASSLYGSDALGGVVAFTTKDPSDYLDAGNDTAGSFKTAFDSSDDTFSKSLTLANRLGTFESLIVYTHREGHEQDNYDDGYAGGQGNNRTKPDPIDYDSDNILVKLQYQINPAHRVGFTLENYDTRTQAQLLSLEGASYNAMFNYSDYSGDDTSQRERYSLRHQWSANNRAFDSLDWHIDWQESETEQETRNFTQAFGYGRRLIDYSNLEETLQISAQFDKVFDTEKLTYGVSYQESELKNTTDKYYLDGTREPSLARYTPVIEAQSIGVFLQYQFNLFDDQLHITPGIRYDAFTADPGTDSRIDTPYEKHDSDKWTARLGAVYKLDDVYSVFAQFSQGFKAPDVEQMYHQDTSSFYRGYVVLANPDLKPEESTVGFETGFRANSDSISLEISAYYNEYKNFIDSHTQQGTYMGADVSIFQSQNIAEATIKGIEARASLWLDQVLSTVPTGTSLAASLAYADGEGRSEGEQANYPIDSIAPLKAVLGLQYDSPANTWGSALSWTLVDEKKSTDISDSESFASSGYGLLDLTVYYQPLESLIVRGGVFNLGDKEYWTWSDVRGVSDRSYIDRFTQPGRNISLSVKYQF